MRGVYTVEFENVSVSAQVDFFEITPADDRPVAIIGMTLDQMSDVGDAAEEILRYRVIRGHTTSGSGGATPTPVALSPRDAAAGFTAETNNTTIASAGTGVNLHSGAFNIRMGERLFLPPEFYCESDQGQTLIVVRLMASPADAVTISGTLYVLER